MNPFNLLLVSLFIFQSILSAQSDTDKLQEGTKAPLITTQDLNGEKITLNKILKNNDKVLITFMRPVWCPVCNTRTHELIENYEKLKSKGYEVVVIYPSPAATMKEYTTDHKLPFIVISDYNEELYGLFHIEKDPKKIAATFKSPKGKKDFKTGQTIAKEHKSYPRKGDNHGPLITADFVIDNKQNLLNVYYGKYMGDHLPLDTL